MILATTPSFQFFKNGPSNVTLQMKYTYSATNIRISQPGAILFPEEKVKNEVAVMRYLRPDVHPNSIRSSLSYQREERPEPEPVYHGEPY